MAQTSLTAVLWELVAIDKKTGRRVWTMGGPPVEEKFGNELANGWLAGPPGAVDRGNLYQVVEKEAVVQLVCLDAGTGQLRWRVPLSYSQSRIGSCFATIAGCSDKCSRRPCLHDFNNRLGVCRGHDDAFHTLG